METFVRQCSTYLCTTTSHEGTNAPFSTTQTSLGKGCIRPVRVQGQAVPSVVDYYSRYPEVIQLTATTSSSVISSMKSIFSRHGIPRTVVSNNGPQYNSAEMKDFASSYGFNHGTSSHYPQSNGLAERTVKTVKGLLAQTTDPYLALLTYRATPFPWCGLSPAELLMGWRLKTDVPQVRQLLVPNWPHLKGFEQKDMQLKLQQKKNYDCRHRVRPLPPLSEDTPV